MFSYNDAPIIHSRHFERAVCKVQQGVEGSLSRAEATAIQVYKISESDENENEIVTPPIRVRSLAEEALEEAYAAKKAKTTTKASKYRSMNHIAPTSNIVERLFSRAKLVMTDQRKIMAPYRLELLLFLRCNKILWSAATVDLIFEKEKQRSQEVPVEDRNDV